MLYEQAHYFVCTGGHGKQMYGTCLTLWEPYTIMLKPKPKAPEQEGEEKPAAGEGVSKEVFLPKCLVLLSNYPYLSVFREYLTQLHRLSKMGEMTLPIERYISNFCSEIPAPPPGSFEVQTTILDSVIRIWSPPHNLPIPWVSLPFGNLFECLDIDNIILVWHCMVLERQVLLTSTQLSILTTASEIFLSLLFPFRWSHAYIPLLPHFLIPILSAPMPFLCGINKANLADALYDLSRECVLVDLDKNLVTLGPDTVPLPPIPPVQEAALRSQLEDNVGMVFREARSLTRSDDYSDGGTHLPSHTKLMAEAMWESKLSLYDEAFHLVFTPEESRKNVLNGNDASGMDYSDRDVNAGNTVLNGEKQNVRQQSGWDAVQESFLDSFVYLLRNYRKYLVFPSKHNEGSYGGAGFRSKEYIESQRYDMRDFLTQLIGTQMFDNFITKRLYGSGEADVAFFDMAVDRFLKSAGMFSDVNLSGRIASSFNKPAEKRGNQNSKSARGSKPPKPSTSMTKNEDPLWQSARVHRKLKTIVPPEPTGEGLPPRPLLTEEDNVTITTVADTDDTSVHSASTSGTSGTKLSQTGSTYKSVQEKEAEILEKQKQTRYAYATFPSELSTDLFGTPRPLPAAVIAEFDRQRKDAARFRRKGKRQPAESTKHIQRAHSTVDPVAPPSPEAATFTVFFMAFTAMVGKDLLAFANDGSRPEKTILSSYVPMTAVDAEEHEDVDSDYDAKSMDTDNTDMVEGGEEDSAVDEAEQEGVAEMKAARPDMGEMFGEDEDAPAETPSSNSKEVDSNESKTEETEAVNGNSDAAPTENGNHKESEFSNNDPTSETTETTSGYATPPEEQEDDDDNTQAETVNTEADTVKSSESHPRQRFRDKVSDLQIEEAKATGRAQLGLAFEILTMMKKRALKADPEAYQALIDACGRVGDTKRATELLGKMHEDGIVADGVVYACLVSAFSAESSWRDKGKEEEELPEWANSTAVEMDWNKLQKRSLLDRIVGKVVDLDDEDEDENEEVGAYQKLRNRIMARRKQESAKPAIQSKTEDKRQEFFVTEAVERQIALGENLLEIVFPDISVDTENEVCPRCNYLLSDEEVVTGWKPLDSNEYTTSCPNCTQRFVPHFCVQCSSPTFMGSRGPASPLTCERLSPWVLQKEIRSVMSDREGIDNLVNPKWVAESYKNSVSTSCSGAYHTFRTGRSLTHSFIHSFILF
jgi:pentatricopeptide repeat protein